VFAVEISQVSHTRTDF